MFQEFQRQRHFGEAIYPVMMEFCCSLYPTPLLRCPFTTELIIMIADDGVTDFSPGSPRSVQIHSPILDDTNQQSKAPRTIPFTLLTVKKAGRSPTPLMLIPSKHQPEYLPTHPQFIN
jgi:hypothetical protein